MHQLKFFLINYQLKYGSGEHSYCSLHQFANQSYYKKIYSEINDKPDGKGANLKQQTDKKIETNRQFHEMMKEYLVSQGFNETLKAVFENSETKTVIQKQF